MERRPRLGDAIDGAFLSPTRRYVWAWPAAPDEPGAWVQLDLVPAPWGLSEEYLSLYVDGLPLEDEETDAAATHGHVRRPAAGAAAEPLRPLSARLGRDGSLALLVLCHGALLWVHRPADRGAPARVERIPVLTMPQMLLWGWICLDGDGGGTTCQVCLGSQRWSEGHRGSTASYLARWSDSAPPESEMVAEVWMRHAEEGWSQADLSDGWDSGSLNLGTILATRWIATPHRDGDRKFSVLGISVEQDRDDGAWHLVATNRVYGIAPTAAPGAGEHEDRRPLTVDEVISELTQVDDEDKDAKLEELFTSVPKTLERLVQIFPPDSPVFRRKLQTFLEDEPAPRADDGTRGDQKPSVDFRLEDAPWDGRLGTFIWTGTRGPWCGVVLSEIAPSVGGEAPGGAPEVLLLLPARGSFEKNREQLAVKIMVENDAADAVPTAGVYVPTPTQKWALAAT